MLHYYVKDFFAPVIVTPHLSISNELSIYVVSDLLHVLTNCTIEIHVYKWGTIEPVFVRLHNDIIIVSINRVTYIYTQFMRKYLHDYINFFRNL